MFPTLADQTLARPDLADLLLEGLARAERFKPTRPMNCLTPTAEVRAEPHDQAERLDQLLHGETFRVLEESAGWAWGQSARDGQVGFVRLADLGPESELPTHRVAQAWVAIDGRRLPLNALVVASDGEGLADLHTFDSDCAEAAERLLGAPYADGGRTAEGIDGWGLVRQALFAVGRGAPALLEDGGISLGRRLAGDEAPVRGDIILAEGGPGVVCGPGEMIRSRTDTGVAREPLPEEALYFRP